MRVEARLNATAADLPWVGTPFPEREDRSVSWGPWSSRIDRQYPAVRRVGAMLAGRNATTEEADRC